jgi:GWxTD domain-containing protein
MRLILTSLLVISAYTHSFGLWAYMNNYQFHVPGDGPYMEVVITVDGKTIDYKEVEPTFFRSSIELVMVVYQGNEIVSHKKSILESENLLKDEFANLTALERFPLKNGEYTFELTIKDLNSKGFDSETQVSQWIINQPENNPFVSSVQFIGAYTPTTEENAFSKSGYDIVPLVSSHFQSETNVLVFYNEIYQTDKQFGPEGVFVTNMYIAQADGTPIEESRRIKREKAMPVIAGIVQMDISKLKSGDYLLVVEVRDKQNEIITSGSTAFSRTFIPTNVIREASMDEVANSFAATFTDRDSLLAVIQAHLPIANSLERNTIDYMMPTANLQQMQSFLYSFWLNRDEANAETKYREYQKEVNTADGAFGTRIQKGWQTDRGRIYLQYGRPNTRIERPHSTDYFPFEIWHYYETGNLHDRRFLFYNPSLSGDYELLHSDVPGEVQNPDWRGLARSRGMDSPANTSRRQNENRDRFTGDELEELFFSPR